MENNNFKAFSEQITYLISISSTGSEAAYYVGNYLIKLKEYNPSAYLSAKSDIDKLLEKIKNIGIQVL